RGRRSPQRGWACATGRRRRQWIRRACEVTFVDLSRRGLDVAPMLLGAFLTSTLGGEKVTVRLTEVEAYEGADDPASHGYRGRTPRNEVMFGPPGAVYVYWHMGL